MEPPVEDKLDFLRGQVRTLIAFAVTVSHIHPERQTLAEQFDLASQAALANSEATLVSDFVLDGMRKTAERIQRALPSRQPESPAIPHNQP